MRAPHSIHLLTISAKWIKAVTSEGLSRCNRAYSVPRGQKVRDGLSFQHINAVLSLSGRKTRILLLKYKLPHNVWCVLSWTVHSWCWDGPRRVSLCFTMQIYRIDLCFDERAHIRKERGWGSHKAVRSISLKQWNNYLSDLRRGTGETLCDEMQICSAHIFISFEEMLNSLWRSLETSNSNVMI